MPGEWDWALQPTPAPRGLCSTRGSNGAAALLGLGLGFRSARGGTEQPHPSPGVGAHCWGAPAVTEAGTLRPSLVPYRQQHQMELEAAPVPGAVLPELVEAQLVRGRAHRTPSPPTRVSPGTGLPAAPGLCCCAAGSRCPARAPAVQQGLTTVPAPCSPTGEGGAGEETRTRLLDAVSVPSLPRAQPPAAGLPAGG